MSITRPPTTITSAWGDAVTNWINARTPVFATSGTASTGGTTTELKDTNVGDVTITVASATDWYRVTYACMINSTVSLDLIIVRVRDGGASSPTNTSPVVGQAQDFVQAAGGPGQRTVNAISLRQFTVGTHNLAPFYVRAVGSGTVNVVALDGGSGVVNRFLSIEKIT